MYLFHFYCVFVCVNFSSLFAELFCFQSELLSRHGTYLSFRHMRAFIRCEKFSQINSGFLTLNSLCYDAAVRMKHVYANNIGCKKDAPQSVCAARMWRIYLPKAFSSVCAT